MRDSLFSREYVVYWPDQYEPLVNFLRKPVSGQSEGKSGFFENNMEVIVFAASYGLRHGHSLPADHCTKEISTAIFENNGYGSFLYLIPLMACKERPDLYLLRDTVGEEKCIRTFESYVAGGLQLLNEEWSREVTKSALMFVDDLLLMGDKLQSNSVGSMRSGSIDDIW